MPRDCCAPLECSEGDWSSSTDYTCQHGEGLPVPTEADYRKWVTAIFKQYKPQKLHNTFFVDELLAKWAGRWERLMFVLERKYGAAYNVERDPRSDRDL